MLLKNIQCKYNLSYSQWITQTFNQIVSVVYDWLLIILKTSNLAITGLDSLLGHNQIIPNRIWINRNIKLLKTLIFYIKYSLTSQFSCCLKKKHRKNVDFSRKFCMDLFKVFLRWKRRRKYNHIYKHNKHFMTRFRIFEHKIRILTKKSNF